MKIIEGHRIDRGWALLFARLVLGLIFFMAGVWKVFQLGPVEHARKFFLPFADTFLPGWSLWAVGVGPILRAGSGSDYGRKCGQSFQHYWGRILS